jgi:hypothetical protein
VPDHWVQFGHRRSALSASGRRAVDPINALLNYLYALLAGEACIAAIAVGLDPGLGILHLDKRSRDSFALDLMEPARTDVERYVLDLLQGHIFQRTDFIDNRHGGCQVGRALTHRLSETTGAWRDALARPTEQVAALLIAASDVRSGAQETTPLTQSNRRRAKGSDWPGAREPAVKPPGNCDRCGNSVPDSGRLCLTCRSDFQLSGEWHEAGRRQLATMRSRGDDPAHGGAAGQKRSASISRQNLLSADWSRQNSERPRVDDFAKTILPGLQLATLQEMANATGLSLDYCSKIRRGLLIPHPRHWDGFRSISESVMRRVTTAPDE